VTKDTGQRCSTDYARKVGTVVYSDETVTVVRYEYDCIVEEIAWPTNILMEENLN
jgi:hypothetical protein